MSPPLKLAVLPLEWERRPFYPEVGHLRAGRGWGVRETELGSVAGSRAAATSQPWRDWRGHTHTHTHVSMGECCPRRVGSAGGREEKPEWGIQGKRLSRSLFWRSSQAFLTSWFAGGVTVAMPQPSRASARLWTCITSHLFFAFTLVFGDRIILFLLPRILERTTDAHFKWKIPE